VVYNHTYVIDTPFNRLVPYYYYRLKENGEFSNGSGCGNELATERTMVRKFIIDSLKHWVRNYHVDGFRFDLMALLGKSTVLEIERELRQVKEDLLLYGEPWSAASSSIKDVCLTKGEQRNINIAVFNDDLRNALKGYPVDESKGFVSGERGWETGIVIGMLGEIDYSHVFKGFTAHPTETINYASAHDNLTLYDKLIKSVPKISFEERKRMAALALSIILTSQGIAFIHAGSEMLRTKFLEENSYRSGSLINELNYLQKRIYRDFHEYIRGLILLRKNHLLFRLRTADEVRRHVEVLHIADGFVSVRLKDDQEEILVAHNARNEAVSLNISGTWKLLVYDCKIDLDGQRKVLDTIKVERLSTTVAIRMKDER
jgi:pullulanase